MLVVEAVVSTQGQEIVMVQADLAVVVMLGVVHRMVVLILVAVVAVLRVVLKMARQVAQVWSFYAIHLTIP